MNVMLASGGYPWTVVRMKRRDAYLAALESVSMAADIKLLVRLLAGEMRAWKPG